MPEDPANQPNAPIEQPPVSPPPTTTVPSNGGEAPPPSTTNDSIVVPPAMPPDDFSSPPPQTDSTFITENLDTPPLIITPPSPPRSKAKIVGSILALLILIVGIPAGIFLVNQNQEVRERASECAEETTYTVSGNVRDQDGNGKNGVTICLDPSSNGCSGAAFSTQTTGNGNYAIANVPAGGAGHNVYLDPQTLPSGFTVSSSVPNPKLIGPEICTDAEASAIFIIVPSSTGGGGGGGTGTPSEAADCSSVRWTIGGSGATYIEASKQYGVFITMQNSSSVTWTPGEYVLIYPVSGAGGDVVPPLPGHAASVLNSDISTSSWVMEVPLRLGATTSPGSGAIFGTTVTAPTTPGTYTFYWRMMKISAGAVFGGQCQTDVQVVAAGGSPTGTTCPATSGPIYYCEESFIDIPNNANNSRGCTNVEQSEPSSGLVCAGQDYCFRCQTSSGGGGGGGGGGSGIISAECRNVSLYNASGTRLAQTDLPQLKAGDTIKIAVGGSTNSGSIDRARFKVNGSFQPDAGGVVTTDPATNEFYINYQIPAGITSFTIDAQLHHTNPSVGEGGWF